MGLEGLDVLGPVMGNKKTLFSFMIRRSFDFGQLCQDIDLFNMEKQAAGFNEFKICITVHELDSTG